MDGNYNLIRIWGILYICNLALYLIKDIDMLSTGYGVKTDNMFIFIIFYKIKQQHLSPIMDLWINKHTCFFGESMIPDKDFLLLLTQSHHMFTIQPSLLNWLSPYVLSNRRTQWCSTFGTSVVKPACQPWTSASSQTRPYTCWSGTWRWEKNLWPTCRHGCSTSRWKSADTVDLHLNPSFCKSCWVKHEGCAYEKHRVRTKGWCFCLQCKGGVMWFKGKTFGSLTTETNHSPTDVISNAWWHERCRNSSL